MDGRVILKIRLGQFENRHSRREPLLLQVDKGACQLDQSLVKCALRPLTLRQPQLFQHIVSFVEQAPIKAFEITEVMRVQIAPPATFN